MAVVTKRHRAKTKVGKRTMPTLSGLLMCVFFLPVIVPLMLVRAVTKT